MILSDYHVHTSFSSDSEAPMESMVEQGIQFGLQHLCITDHMDIDFPLQYKDRFIFDVPSQQKKMDEMISKYNGQIKLYKGVELGLQPHIFDKLTSFTDQYEFDFIIGSTHLIHNTDPYHPEYWEQFCNTKEALLCYYETVLKNINGFHNFDVLGHIDYIVRYIPKSLSFTYQLIDYIDILDEILKKIISLGKGIEINTGGYRKNLHPNPEEALIRRYKELGGEIITIGSDAHVAKDIGFYLDRVSVILETLGIRYYTIFKNRKPEFIPV